MRLVQASGNNWWWYLLGHIIYSIYISSIPPVVLYLTRILALLAGGLTVTPLFLLSSSFLLPFSAFLFFSFGEASKNSSGEKASSLQQHGNACQLASLLGYPSSVPLVVTSCSSLDDDLFFYQFLFPHLLSLEV